jgi:two-component system response regulator HydG
VVTIVVTGATDLGSAVSAMRAGAYDYLTKPVDPATTLLPSLTRTFEHRNLLLQNQQLRRQLGGLERSEGIVGDSLALRELLTMIAAVAPTDATVLVVGETGTGKELAARAVHRQSRRNGRPFVAINCGALTETLLESELFGHARGAFTGAGATRRGLFEEASGGTLFLDEVGELTPATQVRLLRVLQERQVRPVGSNKPIDVDVRVVAATNRNLVDEVAAGRFREDLYYRLDVMRLELPPLRDRPEDVPQLVQHFLSKRGERLGKQVRHVDPIVLARLSEHPWPGNIRELENAVDRAIVLAKDDTITPDLLGAILRQAPRSVENEGDAALYALPLTDARAAFEERYLQRVMERGGGRATEAARLAGMDRSNFRRMLKRVKMDAPD